MYNIAIVEDESIELESLHRIIAQSVENATIYEASTGNQALKLIDRLEQIDLMFVDINIPLPDGRGVIEYLRRKSHDAKVIVITANDDFDIVRSMLNLNVQDYLLKPVKQCVLTEAIRNTLDIDENDIAAGKDLKREVNALIDSCDYGPWHQFLFDYIDNAWCLNLQGQDNRRSVTLLLEILCQYPAMPEGKLLAGQDKLQSLGQEITRYGLSDNLYYRLVTALLQASSELFEITYKQRHGSMDFIARAKFHIEKNILDNLALDDIAACAFVSPCYLSRAFNKATSTGFSNYVTGRKIRIAQSLLQFSDLQVNTIALVLGWQDANYFCRIFKKVTGQAPSDFRRDIPPRIH